MADTRAPEKCGKNIDPYLDTIYEDTEHRLSCESALARVLPIGVGTWCESVNSPFPENDTWQLRWESLFHYAEAEETLKVGAVKIAERTRRDLDGATQDAASLRQYAIIEAMTLALKSPYEIRNTPAGDVPVFPETEVNINDFIDWVLVQRETAGDFIKANPGVTRQHIRDYLLAVVPDRFRPICEKRDWLPDSAYQPYDAEAHDCEGKPYRAFEGIFGGIPLFPDSRVPLYFLIDIIDADVSLDEFFYSWGNQIEPPAVEELLTYPLPVSHRHARSLV